MALCTQNGIGFFGETEQVKTLYLDWETDYAEMCRRTGMLTKGTLENIAYTEIVYPHYLRMSVPLVDALNHLTKLCFYNDYRFIIIDSAFCAVGGNINDAEYVARFHEAVRKLNTLGITTLTISHVSKAARNSSETTPIGSVGFENFPRLAWRLESEWDTELKRCTLVLRCHKSNVGKLNPIGIELTFGSGGVYVSRVEVENPVQESLTEAILGILSERPRTPREIADELRVKPEKVWNALYRLKKRGRVEATVRGLWRLAAREKASFIDFPEQLQGVQ